MQKKYLSACFSRQQVSNPLEKTEITEGVSQKVLTAIKGRSLVYFLFQVRT